MSHFNNRNKIIDRIEKELIGPGSDIFYCDSDFSNEIIEGKPLQRYFSAILFPKQKIDNDEDTGKEMFSEFDDEENIENNTQDPQLEETELESFVREESEDDLDTFPKYNSNAFFPSNYGISICVSKNCNGLRFNVSFGNYKKAKYDDIALPYTGSELHFLAEFGLDKFVIYNEDNKTLKQFKEINRKENGHVTDEYSNLQNALKSMSVSNRNSVLFKHLTKLFFKDKYKRYRNEISVNLNLSDLLNAESNQIQINLSQVPNLNIENWHKDNIDNIILHVKLFNTESDKYFIRAVIENKYAHSKEQFSLSKEKLNLLAIFQVEIKVISNFLIPFRDYRPHIYKSDEDKLLDYLYRDKLAYCIGHNVSCTWENCEQDNFKPNWVKTTFIPSYSVKSQSTETDKIDRNILNIKNLSIFENDKNKILKNLHTLADAYFNWITDEKIKANGNEYGIENIMKCKEIHKRIKNGIELLSNNDNAYRAFQLANTSIFIQMFQNEMHFNKKDGFEVFERDNNLQFNFDEYATKSFPNNKKEPVWRPFQLAFILQCISSFVEESCKEKDLVDLLYFPTGGGKTEAYLAVSAFLIFWRRLSFQNQYDGVNIIIRYTLRLLSAQQFERATKLILACEFIRQNQNDLGSEKITIGFWIGNATIPNSIEQATVKHTNLLEKLNDKNFDGKNAINPFQLTNCQWCNSKIISRIKETDTYYSVGHRINNKLLSFCLNPDCNYNETSGCLPIVLIDDDIYKKPPTVLFGTVDKFASLAWKGEANKLFNYNNNRKPELIIQDELHLLNGPLGSLVGLFENVILSLCTTINQSPKIIASTATIKNVEAQIQGLYRREAKIFPQYATNSDDTFFSKTLGESKRKYIGILPTGKTTVMTNLQLLSSLLFARLEIWEQSSDKKDADKFWTLLSYFKSLKEIGRFSNKISSELKPIIQQLQVRRLKNYKPCAHNYWKLSYRNLELTSRIPNEKIKKNLDKLEIQFDGNIENHKAYDLVLATNMISVGLDVGRLGIMVMNGMPPNTAEYIQASSRVARENEGLVVTLFDPFNTRDISYFEDFIQFHKTFYRKVEPLSVTPFAENALEKMLFTLMVTFYRHKLNYAENSMANKIIEENVKTELQSQFSEIFSGKHITSMDKNNIMMKIKNLIQNWQIRVGIHNNLKFFWPQHYEQSLLKRVQDKKNYEDVLVTMQSMRNVDPNADILIKQQ